MFNNQFDPTAQNWSPQQNHFAQPEEPASKESNQLDVLDFYAKDNIWLCDDDNDQEFVPKQNIQFNSKQKHIGLHKFKSSQVVFGI